MSQFEREERYMVVKLSKLSEEFNEDGMQRSDVIYRNAHFGKALVDCVVVEKDWPEYEIVWKMLQDRIEGDGVSINEENNHERT